MKHSLYIYIAIIILFISSFPLALGWLPLGAYIPRVTFMLISLILYPFVLKTRQFFFLCLYYLYVICACLLANKSIDYIGLSANFMEIGIPIIVMTIFAVENKAKNFELMGIFCLIMTLVTITTSLLVLTFIDPNAIRALVGLMANGEPITPYLRMGVADYSTSSMIMAMPCILIGILRNKPRVLIVKMLCLLGIVESLFFMYKASVTTTFLICLILTASAFLVNPQKSIKTNMRIVILLLFLSLLVVPLVLQVLSTALDNEEITTRTSLLADWWGTGSSTYEEHDDLGIRMSLYQRSLNAFLSNPLFGNVSSTIGGHNYLLDRLGEFGIVGTSFLLALVILQCKKSYRIIPQNYRIYYILMVLGVFVLSLLKNLAGFDYWTFMFLYYPCILFWGKERNKRYQRT